MMGGLTEDSIVHFTDFDKIFYLKFLLKFHLDFSYYSERRQTMGKVTEWFFLYFLIFKLVRVAKLKFPTFLQLKWPTLVKPEENQLRCPNPLISGN